MKGKKVQLDSLKVTLTRDNSICKVEMILLLLARVEDKKVANAGRKEQVHGG